MAKSLSEENQEFIARLGYDPGEWIHDWVKSAIDKPTLALPLGIVGSTGTGKSNFAWGILWDCVKQGDCVIIPGDASCEFRHFLLYTKKHPTIKLRVLIPNSFNYDFFIGKSDDSTSLKNELKKWNAECIEYDPNKQSVNDFIEPHQILVVFDACYNLESKSWFWQFNLKQIKYRKRYHYIHVTYCFPEGSTYFPNTPFREQYKPVYIHSKDFVEYRKFFMRGIYLYHHSSMLFYLIEKQFETVLKKGSGYDSRTRYDNKLGRGKLIHEYSIIHQGIEDIKLEIDGQFSEIKDIWKVIPDKEINFSYFLDEEEEKEITDSKDEIINAWLSVKDSFGDLVINDQIVELFKLYPYASLDVVRSIVGKGRTAIEKLQTQARIELLQENTT